MGKKGKRHRKRELNEANTKIKRAWEKQHKSILDGGVFKEDPNGGEVIDIEGDPNMSLMIAIGKNDFCHDYTSKNLCVLTTIGTIKNALQGFKKEDAQVGKIVRLNGEADGLEAGQIGIGKILKRDWSAILESVKVSIEKHTPQQLWEMETGEVWQNWINDVVIYYCLQSYIEDIPIPCAKAPELSGIEDGDALYHHGLNFEKK
jgi:hypothetical protein